MTPLYRLFALAGLLHGLFFTPGASAQQTQIKYLSGLDKDHTVNWDFRVSGGRKGGQWTTIPVPSNWEMQGFGTHHYYTDWKQKSVPDSVGLYRHRFTLPPGWGNRKVDIVFGGAMTDTEVTVNGKPAGPVHQGGFYQFRYDITGLLNPAGENLLEVKVKRVSANQSVNVAERKADFWLFSGIYRPVWLEARPPQHISRIALNAGATGRLAVDVFLDGITTAGRVVAQVEQLDGKKVGAAFSAPLSPGQRQVSVRTQLQNVKLWSAEFPNRYRVTLTLKEQDKTLHRVSEKFGFRTVEVRRHDGLYVNNAKVLLKGVNRHTFWPTSGRTTSKEISIMDANLIKDMNMNAVRMSHYPPDPHFLEVADSLGLYVLDELTGWQGNYDTEVGSKLVRELVIRDVNHPSIIFWDNGNEGGFNFELDDDFAQWDPQKRTVLHPWAVFNGFDTGHYEVYDCCAGAFFHGNELIMPTEFLHGLYDGGHGAGLDDWWNLMVRNPLTAGGFLWAFADEGILRADQGDSVDVAGNAAPDGIVGPYRQKEASFYTIREVWAPVYIPLGEQDQLPPTFNGVLPVENRFDHTNLRRVKFSWQLVNFAAPSSPGETHTVAAKGDIPSPAVMPRQMGNLLVKLPGNWREQDALYLAATDPHGRKIYTWTWMIPPPEEKAARLVSAGSGPVSATEQGNHLLLEANGTQVRIDLQTGQLIGAARNGKEAPLGNGPRLVTGSGTLKEIRHRADGNGYLVEAAFEGNLRKINWRMLPAGWLQLNYAYQLKKNEGGDYLGVSFDFPEGQATGMRWLGKGPYRVWKNRRKGVEFDVWEKRYNDAVTGLTWEYPEFKGFHDDVYWATLQNPTVPVTIVFASDLSLRLFTPRQPAGATFDPRFTEVKFPAGDISFLHGITPIGTKFHAAAEHGPAGQPNLVPRLGKWYEATVYFYFGSDLPPATREASR